METEIKQEVQEGNKFDIMKLVKQPMLLAGAAAILLAIVIAIVGTVLNPSQPSVVKKYGEALQKQDVSLLSECYSASAGVSNEELSYELAEFKLLLMTKNITGKVTVEYLVGPSYPYETESEYEVTYVPAIRVIKVGNKIAYISSAGKKIINIDGKEYLYTGREQ